MHFVCLCPTYGRPSIVANAVQLFLDQTLFDGHTAHLVILDDAGQIAAQRCEPAPGKSCQVITAAEWIPLPRKYDAILTSIGGIRSDPDVVYVVWDDDDVYLPWHLKSIARALARVPQAAWIHPSKVWSTYDERRPPLIPEHERPREESARGRFHGALSVTGEMLAAIRGWPKTDLATYDQQMLGMLSLYHCVDPFAGYTSWDWSANMLSYVYRWQDTGKWHCSGSIDQAGHYRRPPIQEPGTVDELIPRYDTSTLQILRWFGPDRMLAH